MMTLRLKEKIKQLRHMSNQRLLDSFRPLDGQSQLTFAEIVERLSYCGIQLEMILPAEEGEPAVVKLTLPKCMCLSGEGLKMPLSAE